MKQRPYGIIYAAINIITGKFYVGKTTKTLAKRKAGHLRSSKNPGTNVFFRSIQKHGWEAFSWFVLDYADSAEELSFKEEQWLWSTNAIHYKFGYNRRTNSCGATKGMKMSDEVREKMRQDKTGRHPSAETREKMSAWQIGRKFSEESREKMRQGHLGRKASEETREKMSLQRKGRKMPDEAIRKSRLARIGQKYSPEALANMRAGQLGRKLSEETKEKIRIANLGKIVSAETRNRLSLAGKGRKISTKQKRAYYLRKSSTPVICVETRVYYDLAVDAAKDTGANSICDVCRGNRKTSGGFHWRYANREERPTTNERSAETGLLLYLHKDDIL